MILSYAPYRLQFKHPFGTAHGIRTGTDAVFVRLEENGHVGYGEATLPPYLNDTLISVVQEFISIELNDLFNKLGEDLPHRNETFPLSLSRPCRAALSTAYYDLKSKQLNVIAGSLVETKGLSTTNGSAMVTLGYSDLGDIELKLSQLPISTILKVKLGSIRDPVTIRRVIDLDNRKLFLDANQGWQDVDQVLDLIELAGEDRIAGIEQPFGKDRWDLHAELSKLTRVPVFGDESIQGLHDPARARDVFNRVNIKLMKCGGIDRAAEIMIRARELDLLVMLGCMSESSLGCGAMAQLAPYSDLVDLDGPWLISNDPFTGLVMDGISMKCLGTTGLGVDLIEPACLIWSSLGA